jgi:hypothetical protein
MGGLEDVDERYRSLHERAIAVLGEDERVVRVDVGGSVGAGTADQWSDLDLEVVATAEGFDSLLGEWPRWLGEITPTVFARTPILPFIVNAVTDEGLTLDIVVWKGEAIRFPPATEYAVGMLSGVRFADVGAALEYAVAEQLRGLIGPFVSLVQRDEHLRHLTGVAHLVGVLTTVFLAETGEPPLGKHWNQTLTAEQQAAAASLPPAGANRDDIIAFGLALARMVLERARPLYDRYDLEWPAALAAVAAGRLRDQLGIEAGDWLH